MVSLLVYQDHLLTKEDTGSLSHCADDIQSALPIKHSNFSGSEDEYQPPTPPLSDYADSLPLPSSHPPNCLSRITTLLIAEQPHKHENWPRNRRRSHSGRLNARFVFSIFLCRSRSNIQRRTSPLLNFAIIIETSYCFCCTSSRCKAGAAFAQELPFTESIRFWTYCGPTQ